MVFCVEGFPKRIERCTLAAGRFFIGRRSHRSFLCITLPSSGGEPEALVLAELEGGTIAPTILALSHLADPLLELDGRLVARPEQHDEHGFPSGRAQLTDGALIRFDDDRWAIAADVGDMLGLVLLDDGARREVAADFPHGCLVFGGWSLWLERNDSWSRLAVHSP